MSKTIDVKALRTKLGKNQTEFWSHIGVTQSGGSRYESGREIPDAVQFMLNIAYVWTEKQVLSEIEKLRSHQ